MNWGEFFRQKRRLQLIQRIGGVPFVLAFLTAEGMVLSLPIFDPTKTILDMDPMVVVGLTSFAGIISSYFTGNALVGMAWRYLRAPISWQLDQKQKDFYSRITKFRANVPPNPTQMNFSFDYYGERIGSVKDYREWLRRQQKMLADRKFKI